MKGERPLIGALLWVFVGAIAATLLFFAYQFASDDEANAVDNHAGYEVQN